MSVGVGLEGDAELVARLERAHAGILDLTDANRDIAQLVDRRATADAPYATGQLAGSSTVTVSADGWGVGYARPYAGFVHWGTATMKARPWLTDAARATEESWMDQLTAHVQRLLE